MVDLSVVRQVSMLDLEVLERLQQMAASDSTGILEIGPYIGGSTIALASGHKGRRRHSVIEAGGSHDNPVLPTHDIIADWMSNNERFGQAGRARLFKGWSDDIAVLSAAVDHCGPIGLFFFDANGRVGLQMALTARYMLPGCGLVIDDYEDTTSGDVNKGAATRDWVTRMIERGAIIQSELIGSTWFGTLGDAGPESFQHFESMGGHAYFSPTRCPSEGLLRVFEDGRELGPGEAVHDTIRSAGLGSYSHWRFPTGPAMMFSTSDNSDPNTNGRRYEFM